MEIRLEQVVSDAYLVPPDDCFVSVRVGDVQKQSRFSATRTYKFPDSKSKFGRVEIYQRVGQVTVSFDGNTDQMEVPCHFSHDGQLESGHLAMKMTTAVAGAAPKEKTTAPPRSKAKQRLDAAQEYLVQHGLEQLLADAMKEVIHYKPKDPRNFLAQQILQHPMLGCETLKLAPPLPGSGRNSAAALDQESSAKAMPPPMPQSRGNLPVEKQQQVVRTRAAVLGKGRFTEYVEDYVKSMPTAAWSNLQCKFPRGKSVVLGKDKFREYCAAYVKSMPTAAWSNLQSKFPSQKPKIAKLGQGRFTEYVDAYVKSVPAADWSDLHSKFPVLKAPVKTSPAAHRLASVGTWLQTPHPALRRSIEDAGRESQLEATSEKALPPAAGHGEAFSKLASVGTWCVPLLEEDRPLISSCGVSLKGK